MADILQNGVRYRSLNIIDDHNREGFTITMNVSLCSKHVICELDNLIAWRGSPQCIRVDNGPEFIADSISEWAKKRHVELRFIEPGEPYQNGYVERFNKSFPEEVLDAYCLDTIKDARVMAHAWLWIYNNTRPHSALGYKTPVAFLAERRKGFLVAFPTFGQNASEDWKSLVKTVIH